MIQCVSISAEVMNVKSLMLHTKVEVEPDCVPNVETLQAMEETEEIFSNGISRFSNLDEMFEELEK